MSSYWSTVDKSRALEGVTRQDLLDFAARLWSTLFVEGLVQGNMTAAESLELERYILDTLKSQPLEKDKLGFVSVATFVIEKWEKRFFFFNRVPTETEKPGNENYHGTCKVGQKSWIFVNSHEILPILPPNCMKLVFFCHR